MFNKNEWNVILFISCRVSYLKHKWMQSTTFYEEKIYYSTHMYENEFTASQPQKKTTLNQRLGRKRWQTSLKIESMKIQGDQIDQIFELSDKVCHIRMFIMYCRYNCQHQHLIIIAKLRVRKMNQEVFNILGSQLSTYNFELQ